MKLSTRIIIALVLSSPIVALAFLSGDIEEELPPRPIIWATVALHYGESVQLAGVLEPSIQTNHAFRLLGRLTSKNVEVGDFVTSGQEIASIERSSFELSVRSALAATSIAQAQLANASANTNRQQTLLASGATTEAAYDAAAQQFAAASSELVRAQSTLSKAREQLEYTRVFAEHDGVVTGVFAQVGETVAPGQTIVTIANAENYEAVVDFPDTICDCLPVGARADVSLELAPSISASGKIREIAPVADSISRTIRARIGLENPPAGFRLGATVNVSFQMNEAPVILLPSSAILMKNDRAYVWLVSEDGTSVFEHSIELGKSRETLVEISSGLEAGMRVAIAGVHNLKNQQPVRLGEELTF